MKRSLMAAGLAVLLTSLVQGQAAAPRKRNPGKALPAAAHKLVAVEVSGSSRYSAKEVLAASGLVLGSTVDESQLEDATKRLAQSGAFSEVSYTYAYSPEGTKVEFHVTDADHFIPVTFDNFVWFSDEELSARLQELVPLFKQQVAVKGDMLASLEEALQGLLNERKIPANVQYLRMGTQDGPVQSLQFSASGLNIHIGAIEFEGADGAELPALKRAAETMEGEEYSRVKLAEFAQQKLLPVYLQRGFLQARFGPPKVKVTDEKAPDVTVSVAVPVERGAQYQLSRITFSGSKIFPAEKLGALMQVKEGEPVNALQLNRDLEAARKLYGTAGYIEAKVSVSPQWDRQSRTVAYDIGIQEGEQYHMGDLDILGLDPRDVDKVRELWTLRQGQPYDISYPARFVLEAEKILPRTADWDATVHDSANPGDKSVDVSVRFIARH